MRVIYHTSCNDKENVEYQTTLCADSKEPLCDEKRAAGLPYALGYLVTTRTVASVSIKPSVFRIKAL